MQHILQCKRSALFLVLLLTHCQRPAIANNVSELPCSAKVWLQHLIESKKLSNSVNLKSRIPPPASWYSEIDYLYSKIDSNVPCTQVEVDGREASDTMPTEGAQAALILSGLYDGLYPSWSEISNAPQFIRTVRSKLFKRTFIPTSVNNSLGACAINQIERLGYLSGAYTRECQARYDAMHRPGWAWTARGLK